MSEAPWITQAREQIGVKELPGQGQNTPAIVQYWHDIHMSGVRDDETPWCAAFVGAMLERSGIKSTRSGAARSYVTWGVPCSPVPGCVVVFSRDGGGHVGFLVGKDAAGHLQVLGGNQGDCVGVAAFKTSRVVAYRWPAGIPVPSDPLPIVSAAAFSTSEK